jgi:hypothetical protein
MKRKGYLRIAGITGNGTKLHHGWIELLDFSYSSFPVGIDRTHRKPYLRVEKETDVASTPLLNLLVNKQ